MSIFKGTIDSNGNKHLKLSDGTEVSITTTGHVMKLIAFGGRSISISNSNITIDGCAIDWIGEGVSESDSDESGPAKSGTLNPKTLLRTVAMMVSFLAVGAALGFGVVRVVSHFAAKSGPVPTHLESVVVPNP